MSVFYLKYRPQSLDDVIGQDHIKKILLGAFEQNKLSHAYLLVGPRGTGKTSTARILAKMVNCEKQSSVVSRQSSDSLKADSGASLKTDSYPCNKCATCLSITDGSNLDLIEIDAASNRGIEDIRSLREKIKLAPTSAKKKVYIIDEVHMLTTEAFNALLKTLEEPPRHALFILATTEVQKLPQTILSRVQRLDFKLASNQELMEALKKIVKSEKIDINEEALKLLVKKSDGSFRDGIKILDQMSSMGTKITMQSLQDFLKSTTSEVVYRLIEALGKKDTTATLYIMLKQIDEGVDIKELILSLMDNLRSIVFIKNGLGEHLVNLNSAEGIYQNLVKISEKFSNQDLIRNLDILQNALEKIKFASILSLPLEIAVVEICEKNQDVIVRNGVTKQSFLEKIAALPVLEESFKTLLPRNNNIEESPSRHSELDNSAATENSSDDIQKLKEKWTLVLETIRPFNFSLEALLRSINITQCTDTTLIMEVPYSFHQRILEAPKNRDLLESIISDILGRSIRVSTVLGNRPQRTEDIANIEVAADDEIIRAAAEIFNSDSVN